MNLFDQKAVVLAISFILMCSLNKLINKKKVMADILHMMTWYPLLVQTALNCRRTSINTQCCELFINSLNESLSCQITLCQNRESDSYKNTCAQDSVQYQRATPTSEPPPQQLCIFGQRTRDILVNTCMTIGFPFECTEIHCILIARVFYSWARLLWRRPRKQHTLLLSDLTREILTTPDKCSPACVYHCPPFCPL